MEPGAHRVGRSAAGTSGDRIDDLRGERRSACERLGNAGAGIVTRLDLVEVNPILDRSNRSAGMMVELPSSLLGTSIL